PGDRSVAGRGLLYRPDHPARVARGEHIGRNVAGDHAARPDHRAIADPHAGTDDRAAADPGVVANVDRPAGLEPLAPLVRRHRMRRRIDVHAGPEEYPRADPHRRDIEDDAVEVEVDVIAERDVAAVVTLERRFDL